MEAAYVGNRVAWLSGPSGQCGSESPRNSTRRMVCIPTREPALHGRRCLRQHDYNNNNDRNLLTQSISSTAVIQNEAAHGITKLLPYPGFPTNSTLQSIIYALTRSTGC